MGRRYVPVTMGSPRFRTVDVGECIVTEAWFPPGVRLPHHVHERPCFAVMLDGSFDLDFAGRSYPCLPASVSTEPAGERHANRIRNGGAHVVVVQPDPATSEFVRPLRGLLEEIHHFSHTDITRMARRVTLELRRPDDLSSLAIESLALGMLVAARRVERPDRSGHPVPRWLSRAREFVHANYRRSFTIRHLAREAGVHPVHLARVFRSHFRTSVGEYVRGLRLDWAARELAASDESIAVIALEAGFADQSHFTRAFKQHRGLTPGRYRRTVDRPVPRRPGPER
ncbi:MAG TPA: AraC family transcriptional regulator [Candidatus Polarisedimenticolaceae bacterium]|nr:AraC family transcriptional regulator [Candidatus Polarisedimenticolaceae bacterium]